jgi:hypothetical protein
MGSKGNLEATRRGHKEITMTTLPATGRYLIRATDDDLALAQFVDGITANPALHLVETVGRPGQPHIAIVETDAITAAALREAFRTSRELSIDPDHPLSLSD